MMNRRELIELLDISCAKALGAWWKENGGFRERSSEAMNELDKLRILAEPDYNTKYVPPAYVIRYQISHIIMAWKALALPEAWLWDRKRLRRRESLRIVDFGAGTSAGCIGATLMLAEAFEDGRSTDCIYFEGIDKSEPMQEMGKLVWEAFTNGVRHRYPNTALAHAVEVMNVNQHLDWTKVLKRGCETLLTAFHVIYQDNSGLKGEINRLTQHIDPTLGVFSCHAGNLGMMRGVFPSNQFNQVYKWNCGYFPKFEKKKDGEIRCWTEHIRERAREYGIFHRPPYLQVADCAILFGLRENTGREEAKNARAFFEERIQDLEVKIHHVQIPDNQVALGRRVVIREYGYDDEEEYTIVGPTETDPNNGRISNASPIGKALIGRTTGEVVPVKAPGGEFEYEIVRVEC